MLSAKILKYVDDVNASDDWDLRPMHYLVLFHNDLPETLIYLHRRGFNLLKRSPCIRATPFQLLLQTGERNSYLALLMSANPDPVKSILSMKRATAGRDVDEKEILRLLKERFQTLKAQKEKMCGEFRAKFNARRKGRQG